MDVFWFKEIHISPLNLPMGDDDHSHPHGESDKRSSLGSVALCEWKGKSLRMFLEERYGTDARGYVHGNLTSHSILVEHSSQHDRYHAVGSDVGLWNRSGFDMTGGGGGWGDGIRWMAPEILSQEEDRGGGDEEGGMIGTSWNALFCYVCLSKCV
jgi:hypothetical protein